MAVNSPSPPDVERGRRAGVDDEICGGPVRRGAVVERASFCKLERALADDGGAGVGVCAAERERSSADLHERAIRERRGNRHRPGARVDFGGRRKSQGTARERPAAVLKHDSACVDRPNDMDVPDRASVEDRDGIIIPPFELGCSIRVGTCSPGENFRSPTVIALPVEGLLRMSGPHDPEEGDQHPNPVLSHRCKN